MKPTPISTAILAVSLLLGPALLAQSPDSANQGAASPASAAEVPRLIKFGGTLLDSQDRPLAGLVGVTFALHAQQTGGAALWMETQNVTPDAHGNYTVLLGANSANGVPAELFASGEARWLEVQVERQTEQPRILLVSVPYALKAGDAQTLGGKPASAYALSGPGATLVAGTTGAAVSASSTGGTPQPAVACTSVTSDGTASINSVAKFTAACNIQNSAITETGGNVGIGTSAPAVALDIVGNNAGMRLSGTGTHQVTVTGASSGRLGQDATGFFFSSDSNGKVIKFLTNNGALHEWMRITSAGNVGVGTTTPAQKLSVAGMLESTSGGYKFPDGTIQTTAGAGTITAVNTAAGSGLIGGGTSGALNLSLLNTCAVNQILRWSGSAWACALAGTVTSVGSGLGLTGGPIVSTGTLAIDPLVVPQLGAPLNTFAGNIVLPGGNMSAATFTSTLVGGPNNFKGPITAAQVNGTGPGANTFAGPITAPAFNGSGASVTNVNAATLGGKLPAAFAQLAAANIFANTNSFGAASFSGNAPGTQTVIVNQAGNGSTGLAALATGQNSGGVFGHASDTTAPAPGSALPSDSGVAGVVDNAAGYGVYGLANSTTGSPAGAAGQSLSPWGSGVLGYNVSDEGSAFPTFAPQAGEFGVQGVALGQKGVGVFGHAGDLSGTGGTFGATGVEGIADTNGKQTGTGVEGIGGFAGVVGASPTLSAVLPGLTSLTTNGFVTAFHPGVVGAGQDAGVIGLGGGATIGSTATIPSSGVVGIGGTGVFGQTTASGGIAAMFTNATGSGLTLRLDGTTPDMFHVTNTGAVTTRDQMTVGGDLHVNGNEVVHDLTALTISGNPTISAGVTVTGATKITGGATIDDLTVTSSLSKPSGSFKIDHPLDPEHKILYHSFVESPDMKNVYDGVATLDADGQAWVVLPAYFEALNKDFRYQLTAIGAPAPSLYIAQEVRGNRFQIAGGKPGGKISWQVTGIRQDAFAEKHRIQVEVEKPVGEQGYYLYPEAYGQPEEKGVAWVRKHPPAPAPAAPSLANSAGTSAAQK